LQRTFYKNIDVPVRIFTPCKGLQRINNSFLAVPVYAEFAKPVSFLELLRQFIDHNGIDGERIIILEMQDHFVLISITPPVRSNSFRKQSISFPKEKKTINYNHQ
jgi:hypothetical protein